MHRIPSSLEGEEHCPQVQLERQSFPWAGDPTSLWDGMGEDAGTVAK